MAKLFFNYSAMNAGKTTLLLQTSHNYKERGMSALLFSFHECLTKQGRIRSRIGIEEAAIGFDNNFDFYLCAKDHGAVACFLVDEAQFLTKMQVEQLCRIVDQLGKPVITYGLRTDFLGELFEGSKNLLAVADKIVEVKTLCFCGRKACMNLRVTQLGEAVTSGDQVCCGGNDMYIPLCRAHHFQAISGELDVSNKKLPYCAS